MLCNSEIFGSSFLKFMAESGVELDNTTHFYNCSWDAFYEVLFERVSASILLSSIW